jgi:alpha-L-rhamnosidase
MIVRKIMLYLVLFLNCCIGSSEFSPTNLRCEYLTEPVGIDVPKPRLSWLIESSKLFIQDYYQIEIATSEELLLKGTADIWNTGKVSGNNTLVVYNGKSLNSYKKYYWRVTVGEKGTGKKVTSRVASFETAIMNSSEWSAQWITDNNDKDFKPSPLFRKSFITAKQVKKARAYITGVGYYEFFLNGQRVGNNMLDPGYTHFDKRILYSSYDITTLLKNGENVAATVLGNGWFNIQSLAVWHFEKARWRNRPQMICQLRIEYSDGTIETVNSDSSWKTNTGAYLFNNLYSGDTYDPRLEEANWKTSGFDDSKWSEARTVKEPAPLLISQAMPPIGISNEIVPISVKAFGDKLYVFDMGVNISGVVRLKVNGPAGAKITLKHGELLDEDGRLNQSNIDCYFQRETNDSPQQKDPDEIFQMDTYFLKGNGEEVFTPSFTYHGFRYVEVESTEPIKLSEENLTALFVHTQVTPVGKFSCSNELLNKIWEATNRSYLSNLHSIPTDCPQREKNGWTADAHISVDLGLLNYDGIKFYEKWMNDFIDNQRETWDISGIIPSAGWGYDNIGPVWDAALFIIPNALYNYYGDTRCIEAVYETCKKYLIFLNSKEQDGYLNYGLGDWVPYKTKTPNDFTSTCFYYHDNILMARFANLLGKDSKAYTDKAEQLRELINSRYFNNDSCIYSNGSQTALATALYMKLVPGEFEQKVADNLVESVRKNNHHLDFGVIGSKFVPSMLSKYGYAADAYKMAAQETAPSWGYWLKEKGFTSLAETWVFSPDYKDASLNHVFLGDISAWMVNSLAGINIDETQPGFRHIIFRPCFVAELVWVKSEYMSVNGLIQSNWKRNGNIVTLEIKVPANCTASVYADGVKEIGTGTHKFVITQ